MIRMTRYRTRRTYPSLISACNAEVHRLANGSEGVGALAELEREGFSCFLDKGGLGGEDVKNALRHGSADGSWMLLGRKYERESGEGMCQRRQRCE